MPVVVMLLASVEVPLTAKLEVPVLFVMLLPLAITKLPTLNAACKSRVEEPVIVRLPAASPKVPVLATATAPALIVVPPV